MYRLLADFSDEALVLLLAKQRSTQHGARLSLLKRHLVAFVKNKSVEDGTDGAGSSGHGAPA